MKFATMLRPRSRIRWSAGWVVLGLLALAHLSGGGQSAAQDNKTALPADLARVAPDAFFVEVFHIDALWNSVAIKSMREKAPKGFPDLAKEFEGFFGVGIPDVERATVVMLDVKENREPVVLFFTKRAIDNERVLKTALPERQKKTTENATIYIGKDRKALSFLNDRLYLFGTPESVEAFVQKPVSPNEGPLSPALHAAATGKHAITAGVNTEPLEMLKDQLPAEIEMIKPLMAAKSALLTVDLTDKLNYELRGTFANVKDAENAAKAVGQLRQLALGLLGKEIEKSAKEGKDAKGITELLKFAESTVKAVKVERKEAVLHASLSVNAEPAMAALVESVQKIRDAAARIKSSNNLKQFALAMLSYHDANGKFPAAAIYDKNGKPLLSWRVTILPYIDQEKLYKEFHLDEPWDSAHNKKLIDKMPPIYLSPDDDPKKPLTPYQAFLGKGAFFEGTAGLRIADFTDGLSNTIMVVEAPKGVVWTKPEDLAFDDAKLLPRVVDPKKNGFMAALCDGSVRFFKKTMKEETLRLYIQRNDGLPIPVDDE